MWTTVPLVHLWTRYKDIEFQVFTSLPRHSRRDLSKVVQGKTGAVIHCKQSGSTSLGRLLRFILVPVLINLPPPPYLKKQHCSQSCDTKIVSLSMNSENTVYGVLREKYFIFLRLHFLDIVGIDEGSLSQFSVELCILNTFIFYFVYWIHLSLNLLFWQVVLDNHWRRHGLDRIFSFLSQ